MGRALDLRAICDRRPVVVAVAGPNGAGKSTFIEAHLAAAGLPVVNADRIAAGLGLDPYEAAALADSVRRGLMDRGESFIFETVFSDPAGEKLQFLVEAISRGWTVVLCFIGIGGVAVSRERVAMRVTQGGHDVPDAKLRSRFPRTVANLAAAVTRLPHVLAFDNDDLRRPFRLVARYADGERVDAHPPLPTWLP